MCHPQGNAYYVFILATPGVSGKAGLCGGTLSACETAFAYVQAHKAFPPQSGVTCFGQHDEINKNQCTLEHFNVSTGPAAFSVTVVPQCGPPGPPSPGPPSPGPPPPAPPTPPSANCQMHMMQCLQPVAEMLGTCCKVLRPPFNASSFSAATATECHACAESTMGANMGTCSCCIESLLHTFDGSAAGIIPTTWLDTVFGACPGILESLPFVASANTLHM
jgi:hypothetical protein